MHRKKARRDVVSAQELRATANRVNKTAERSCKEKLDLEVSDLIKDPDVSKLLQEAATQGYHHITITIGERHPRHYTLKRIIELLADGVGYFSNGFKITRTNSLLDIDWEKDYENV